MEQNKKAILTTLIYSDLFDYPLSKETLWKYLISDKRISYKEFAAVLPVTLGSIKANAAFIAQQGLYCLRGREKIIDLYLKRQQYSEKKLQMAYDIGSILSFIPTICLLGVSGSLSMRNADKDADIDLFIITKKNTIWVTRLLILFVLQLLGVRRKRNEKSTANKICLNMLIDETSLSFSQDQCTLYIAHEIIQLKPLFAKGSIYQDFLQANNWIEKYMPNAIYEASKFRNNKTSKFKNAINSLLSNLLRLFEPFAKILQFWYIRGHLTSEIVTDTMLAFYPIKYSMHVLHEFEKRKKRYAV